MKPCRVCGAPASARLKAQKRGDICARCDRIGRQRYRQSEQGKATQQQYDRSAQRKTGRQRYKQTATRKAAKQRHNLKTNPRRIVAGGNYHGMAKTVEHAAAIHAYAARLIQEYVAGQSARTREFQERLKTGNLNAEDMSAAKLLEAVYVTHSRKENA